MVVFKEIATEDIDAVLGMMQEFYAIDSYPFDRSLANNLLRTFIENRQFGRGWILFDQGRVTGYLIITFVFSFEYGGSIGFLDELYVRKEERGRGLGRAAVEFAKAEADKLSLKLLYLEVEPHNDAAQSLYIAAGFKVHSRGLMKRYPHH